MSHNSQEKNYALSSKLQSMQRENMDIEIQKGKRWLKQTKIG